MTENIFASFDISAQGMGVQRMRLSSVAKNIANANTTKGPMGLPYQREVVTVRGLGNTSFGRSLSQQIGLMQTDRDHAGSIRPGSDFRQNKALSARTVMDNSPARPVYDPYHPDANADGYVLMPNINVVTEMVEMISAQRAFQANASVVEAAKNIARNSLDI